MNLPTGGRGPAAEGVIARVHVKARASRAATGRRAPSPPWHGRRRRSGLLRDAGLVACLAVAPVAGAGALPASPMAPAGAIPPADTTASAPVDTTTRTYHISAGKGSSYVDKGERVIVLEKDVHLESQGTTVDSRRAREFRQREHVFFYDDVRVHDRDLEMTGRTGEFDRRQDWAELRGDVRIRDPHGLVLAERARYYRQERLLWLWGKVDFQDPKMRVQADSVRYRDDAAVGEAFSNVVLTEVESGSQARGEHGFYDRNTSESWLEPAPVLVLRQSGAADTEVQADVVRTNHEQRLVRARGHVRIRRGDSAAGADSALLHERDNRLELRGRPWLQKHDSRMSGREIDVYYHAKEVDRVRVMGDARVVQARSDTALIHEDNVVQGDSANLYFAAGKLQRTVVFGQATSVFVPEESRPERISLNEAQADSIVILFADEKTDEVILLGNATGVYRFYEGDLLALRQAHAARLDSTNGVAGADTTRFDFRRRAEVVNYAAERITYRAPTNDLFLLHAAEVEYQERTLRAGRIHYDTDTDLLDATDRPLLLDHGDRIYGETMGYDLNTRRAWIRSGATEYDQGYYTGRLIRKQREGELQVQGGNYTTCDLATPHYHFESDRMKIYLKDKVVGRPVRLYIGKVPVGFLPFIVNSVNTDRHSGFLQPDVHFGIGEDGRYVHGLDYYWAASPYFDFLFSSDYNETARPVRTSIQSVLQTRNTRSARLSVNARYKVRYHMDGDVTYHFTKDFGQAATQYTINGSHRQTLGERTRLTGRLDYASSDFARRINYRDTNYEQARQRQITSGLTFNRPGDLLSVNVNLARTQILSPDQSFVGKPILSRTAPGLSLTFRNIRLAPTPSNPNGMGPLHRFFYSLQFAPGLSYQRQTYDIRTQQKFDIRTGLPLPDTTSEPDSLVRLEYGVRKRTQTSASTGASLGRQTSLWILNVSPSMSYSESYFKDTETPSAKRHRRSFSTGVGAGTTFYGLFHPRLFGLTALRHRVEPRATLAYVPEIAGQQRRNQSFAFSLGNSIDVKYVRNGEERRLDGLLDWALSTSFNPTILGAPGQPDRKFGNISSSITINRSGPLRVNIYQVYDPYQGRVLQTQIPFGLRLSGKFDYGDAEQPAERRNRVVEEEGAAPGDTMRVQPRQRAKDALRDMQGVQVGGGGDLAWDLGLSYSLSRQRGVPTSANVGLSVGVQPTPNWQLSYRASYDARNRVLANPEIRVTRELHCWRASFSRIFSGFDHSWRYYFRIYVAKHQEDLFFESGERSFGYGY